MPNGSYSKNIIDLLISITQWFQWTNRLMRLIRIEAHLARHSLVVIFTAAIFCLVLLTASWICILGLVYVALSTYLQPPTLLAGLLVLNLFLLLLLGLMVKRAQRNLLFPATCAACLNMYHSFKNRK